MKNNLVNRDKVIQEILDVYEYEYPTADGEFDKFVTRIIPNIIRNISTIDAVEVVRCKECKLWEYKVGRSGICKRFSLKDHTNWVSDVDFCSYGEHKEVSE